MRSFVATIIVAALCAMPVRAADAPKPAEQAQEPYQPGLGEIMALQQMRHSKLWFAGSAGNWPLADYEIGELGEGFENVSKLLGEEIIKQHVGAPVEALQKAVDGKNKSAFTAAFNKLTAGCNACHHALDHAFIVIQTPTSLPYSNQVFAPQK
jgi:hypothetical protein